MPDHVRFFGDEERTFRLTPELILELEAKTNLGVGALARRVFSGEFSCNHVREVVRLGLIGGGEEPRRAEELCRAYVDGQPLIRAMDVAVAVLEALWTGNDPGRDDEPSPQDETSPQDRDETEHA